MRVNIATQATSGMDTIENLVIYRKPISSIMVVKVKYVYCVSATRRGCKIMERYYVVIQQNI